jgi:hypothetical protein
MGKGVTMLTLSDALLKEGVPETAIGEAISKTSNNSATPSRSGSLFCLTFGVFMSFAKPYNTASPGEELILHFLIGLPMGVSSFSVSTRACEWVAFGVLKRLETPSTSNSCCGLTIKFKGIKHFSI